MVHTDKSIINMKTLFNIHRLALGTLPKKKMDDLFLTFLKYPYLFTVYQKYEQIYKTISNNGS